METEQLRNYLEEIAGLKNRLEEAEQLIEAIKTGEVDAFAVRGKDQSEVFTLQSGDYAYRVLVENFSEGAINITEDGLIVYCNKYFHKMLGLPYEEIVGKSIYNFIDNDSKNSFNLMLHKALTGQSKGEINLTARDKLIPVYLSLTSLYPKIPSVGIIITDLSEKKNNENILAEKNKALQNTIKELSHARNFVNNVLASTNHGVISYVAVMENNEVVDFEISYANELALGQFEFPPEEVIGKRLLNVMPGAKQHGAFERILRVMTTRQSESHEIKSPYYDKWFIVHYVPLNDGITCTFVEITEQKEQAKFLEDKNRELEKLYKELVQSEERYHSMVSEVKDYAILFISIDGTVENWNEGAEKIKGYKAHEIIGKNLRIFYTEPDRKNKLPESLLALAKENGSSTHEGWRIRKDGSLFWGSVVFTALHDDNNNIIGFSKVTRDLTERKKADDQLKENARLLERKNFDLENMNKELQSFAYISSHDLREPLRKIQAFSKRILDAEQFTPKTKDYFDRIIGASQRMENLIESLLQFSRANTTELIPELYDLNKIAEEAKSYLIENILESQAVIEIQKLPVTKIIPVQFVQLLTNLLDNAIKYRHPDVKPHIRITSGIIDGILIPHMLADKQKQYHQISVIDNGIGFEKEYNNRIFELFQRLHGRNEYSGTGIGLAICKKIANNHNGFIIAESVPGEGSTFSIYLPYE